ncbi:anion permease, partial [Escherichia coli]
LPVGIILLIVAPWLSYVLYKPEVTHSAEVAAWAGDELKTMGKLTRKELTLIGLVILSLGLWVFGGKLIDATAVGLLA